MATIKLANGATFTGTVQECAEFNAMQAIIASAKDTKVKTGTTKATSKASAPAEVHYEVVWVRDKQFVKYTNADGSYTAHKAIRQVLNDRIKASEGVWNADVKAWEFPNAAKAISFTRKFTTDVTEAELQVVYDKWESRKAAKATKVATTTTKATTKKATVVVKKATKKAK